MADIPEIAMKRKRYVMEDDEEDLEIIVKKCTILSDRLAVASTFGLNSNVDTSTWFKHRGTRITSTDVEIGTLIAVPVDVPDADEQPDEAWAMSSNWYIYHVENKKETTKADVKLLGSLYPMEKDVLEIGRSCEVTLPQYILVTKGKLTIKGNTLLAGTKQEEHIDEKGEPELMGIKVKRVSLHGIPDLDNVARPCSVKNEGIKRMLKIGGMIRMMGDERFDRIVLDLLYDRSIFLTTCQRYVESSENLTADSPFKSFIKMPKLKGLPIYDNKDTLERLLLGDYPLYNRSKISLQDFLRHKLSSAQWGDAPTREGRASFTDAFTNFQQVLVVYFGYSFDKSFEEILELLQDDEDVLQEYNDSYIQIKMEMVISQFYQDIYKERTSLVHPDISMRTPKDCATLLKKYLHEEIMRAKGLAGMNNWEKHPHSRFYAREGTFQKVNFGRKATSPPKAAAQVKTDHSQSGDNGTCVWNLGSLIKATASNGQLVVCRNGKKCPMKHVQLREMTKSKAKEMVGNIANVKLRGSYERAVDNTTGFKTTTTAGK